MEPRTISEIVKDMAAIGTSPETINKDIEYLEKSIREDIQQWTKIK